LSFDAPVALWALALLPVAVVLHRLLERQRMRYAVRFSNLELLAGVAGTSPMARRLAPTALFVLGLVALVFGLARPQATISAPREEATVMLTMDVSRSMLERDVRPNRLQAAKRAARVFVSQLPDRFLVGVVAFSDFADVLTQPTTDRTAVLESIGSLETIGRTAIGDAIATAMEVSGAGTQDTTRAAQRASEDPLDAILLLSDGHQTAGSRQPLDAAADARRIGLPVFTIALGPPERVVERVLRGESSLHLENPPDHDTLRRIAHMTGGRYFSAPTSARLQSIYETLGSQLGFVKDRQEVTFAFAAAGLLLTAAGAALSALWRARFP
jgi:Ca-activated chloride channel family protein